MQTVLIAAILFLVISSPQLYKLVDKLLAPLGVDFADINGCPTLQGQLLHTAVFALAVYLLLNQGQKYAFAGRY